MSAEDDPRSFQARVPTRLIDRTQLAGEKCEVRVIANGVMALFRVGPFDVTRGLIRAPSAWLVEARGPNGEAVLLQLIHVRPANDEYDAQERTHLENRVAKATAALFVETDLPILAHGGVDRDDGSRILFWAMPWREDADRLIASAMYVENTAHLLRVAVDLSLRIAMRHVLGGFEPLLSEHLVLVNSHGADVAGVPVHIGPSWLAPEMPSPRIAPEELPDGRPTKSGDLWRLGHTLLGLAPDFDALSPDFRALIHRLASADISRRPTHATDVILELERIHAALAPAEPLLMRSATGDERPSSEIGYEQISDLISAAISADTRVDTMALPGGEAPTLQDLPAVIGDEELTIDAVPPWAFFFRPKELDKFLEDVRIDLERRELDHMFGNGVVRLPTPDGGAFCYLGMIDLARACHRAPVDKWPELIRADFDNLLEATARDPDVGTPVDFEIEPAPLADTTSRRLDSLDGVLEPLPIVLGRRMSEQVHAALPFEAPDSPAALGTEPTVAMPPVPASAVRPRSTPPLIDGMAAPTLGPELRAIATNRGPKRTMLAAFLMLSSFGVAAWTIQHLDEIEAMITPPPPPPAVLHATAANVVNVEASPEGTIVVSERDGRVLGRAPIELIVPPGHSFTVLVAAEHHEPQRLVLPDRGTISTRLPALPEDASTCAIDLEADDVDRFEGVGADLAWGDRLAVRGAAVVRTRDGEAERGAWLVRCPNFGGGDRVELVRPALGVTSIEITGPVGYSVEVDGETRGMLPATILASRAFTRIRVSKDGRSHETWIPSSYPAAFELPEPIGGRQKAEPRATRSR